MPAQRSTISSLIPVLILQDLQTPGHLAAATGSLPPLQCLVEAGISLSALGISTSRLSQPVATTRCNTAGTQTVSAKIQIQTGTQTVSGTGTETGTGTVTEPETQ